MIAYVHVCKVYMYMLLIILFMIFYNHVIVSRLFFGSSLQVRVRYGHYNSLSMWGDMFVGQKWL